MATDSTDPAKLSHATAVLPPLPVGAPAPGGKSRYRLHLEAEMWRHLMNIGMYLHKLCPPWLSGPDYKRTIPATVSPRKGEVGLCFYTPEGYDEAKDRGEWFPVVVVFHGGGFTLGRATDDIRWCRAITTQLRAVAVSVDYRCAPEHPFPTAVEDGVDALLYLAAHANELCLDSQRICVSGFSAGGNMAFSVPLRLHTELLKRHTPTPQFPHPRIAAICAWYPSTDYTRLRSERRKTNIRPEKELPRFFTDLFDASYLYPSSEVSLDSPYLSPGVAPKELLEAALPENVVMFTCEWDELLAEGRAFADRLREMGKRVHYHMIKGVPHGFDKDPNPFWQDPQVGRLYEEGLAQVGTVLRGETVVTSTEHAS